MSSEAEKQISEIHCIIVLGTPLDPDLTEAARAVVDARYYDGADGWDVLKNAIGKLEDIVGRTK